MYCMNVKIFHVVYCQRFLKNVCFENFSQFLAWSIWLFCHLLCNTTNTVTPGGIALWNETMIVWKMQVSKNRALENTTDITVCLQGFALRYQSLLQFLGLVGLSKGTVVFHLFYWPFWGHDLMCGLNFLIYGFILVFIIFSFMDEMQNLIIKLSCWYFFLHLL